jgi:hypothetical protein
MKPWIFNLLFMIPGLLWGLVMYLLGAYRWGWGWLYREIRDYGWFDKRKQ